LESLLRQPTLENRAQPQEVRAPHSKVTQHPIVVNLRRGGKFFYVDPQRHHSQSTGRHSVPRRHQICHGGGVGENLLSSPRRSPRQEAPTPSLAWSELQRKNLKAEIVHDDDGGQVAAKGKSIGGTQDDIQIVACKLA